MGLGVALGAATRSFQDTTRQLEERDWLAKQRQREQEKWEREEAIRRTYEQTAKPGEEVAPVTVNGAQYEMTPQQAAIYREAAQNPATQYEDGTSSVGAIGPSRRQTEQGYMSNVADRIAGFDPRESMQLRAQAKQLESSDMQLATQRNALDQMRKQRAVMDLAMLKDKLSDEQWYRAAGEIMTWGKEDGLKADVRVGEDGKPQMWVLTPDGKQEQVEVPGTREEQLNAMVEYLDIGNFNAARKDRREDRKDERTFNLKERELEATRKRYDDAAKLGWAELDAKRSLYAAQAGYYTQGGGRGGKADPTQTPAYQAAIEEYNAASLEYEDALTARDPAAANIARRKLSLVSTKLANLTGKPRDIGKGGDMTAPKTDESEQKLVDELLKAGTPDEDIRAAINTRRALQGKRTLMEEEYGLGAPGGTFFAAPPAAARPAPASAGIERSPDSLGSRLGRALTPDFVRDASERERVDAAVAEALRRGDLREAARLQRGL